MDEQAKARADVEPKKVASAPLTGQDDMRLSSPYGQSLDRGFAHHLIGSPASRGESSSSSSQPSSRRELCPSPETTSTSGTSISSRAEVDDKLFPLRGDPRGDLTVQNRRPSLVLPAPSRFSPYSPSHTSPPLGLSELLAGSSPASPPSSPFAQYTSYFPPQTPDADCAPQPRIQRRPTFSPFRSYYGERRPSERATLVRPIDDKHGQSLQLSHFPNHSQPASDPPTPPQKAASDSGLLSLDRKSAGKIPRVSNAGSVLAPHGTFTSARSRSSTINSQLSGLSAIEPDFDERKNLLLAAGKGDQLAMYKLGWRPHGAADQRHTLGSAQDVWGPPTVPSQDSRRSSSTSDGTESVVLTTTSPPSGSTSIATADITFKQNTDLFTDAANLALRDSAKTNKHRRSQSYSHGQLGN